MILQIIDDYRPNCRGYHRRRMQCSAGLLSISLACAMIVASTWWSITYKLLEAGSVANGDPSTVLPSLVGVFFIVAVPFFPDRTQGKFKPTTNIRHIRTLILIRLRPNPCIGWLSAGEMITPAAISWQEYGSLFPGARSAMYGCPPWCLSSVITYNPWFFLVDFATSFAIVYTLAPYTKRFSRELANSLGFLSLGRRISLSWRNHRSKFSALTMIGLVALIGAESALLATTTSASDCPTGLQWLWKALRRIVSSKYADKCNGHGQKHWSESNDFALVHSSVLDWSLVHSGILVRPNHSSQLTSSVTILIDGKDFTFDWGITYSLKITPRIRQKPSRWAADVRRDIPQPDKSNKHDPNNVEHWSKRWYWLLTK